jgi:tetratricopeptide (TPR) repeat protein
MPDFGRLFRDLRRRKVFRVAAAYAVGAWIIVQVADTAFPHLGLPSWTVTLVIVLVLAGAPLAMVLAWAFDVTPEGVRRTPAAPEAAPSAAAAGPANSRAARLVASAAVLVSLLVAGSLALSRREFSPALDLDPNTLVVAPARATGADPSLGYLREGLVDLLATRLTGRAGPRALDSRTTLSAWRALAGEAGRDLSADSAILVAQGLGAGQLLLIEVVGRPEQMHLSARIFDTATGGVGPPATVVGPEDSLLVVVDRLAATLLSIGAGEFEERLDQLTSTSLPALRAYLEAQAFARQGGWERAVDGYSEALRHDSTFALAAIGLNRAAGWLPGLWDAAGTGLQLAWAARDRLAEADLAYLRALVGSSYPDPTPAADRLTAWERVVTLVPDRADVWLELGEILMHQGALIEAPDAASRAIAAFERALALDSSFAGPLVHLVDLPLYLGDLATAEHYLSHLQHVEPTGLWSPVLAWAVGMAAGDSAAVQAFREQLDTLPINTLRGVYTEATMAGTGFGDAERALRLADRRAGTSEERRSVLSALHTLAMNGGRPSEGLRIAEEMRRLGADRQAYLRDRILDALFWDGDTLAAAGAAAELAATNARPVVPGTGWSGLSSRCVLEQWKLSHGDASSSAAAIALFAAPRGGAEDGESLLFRTTCAHLLEALQSHVLRRPDAGDRLEGRRRSSASSRARTTAGRLRAAHGLLPSLAAASDRVQLQEIGTQHAGPAHVRAVHLQRGEPRAAGALALHQRAAGPRPGPDGRAGAATRARRDGPSSGSTMGLHSSEVAHSQFAPLLAHHMATDESEETRRFRDDVVLLLMPGMNPDGHDIVVDWYRQQRGTPFETTSRRTSTTSTSATTSTATGS